MIVVKVGGGEGIEIDPLLDDVAHLMQQGTPVVLVHGGSHETNEVATQLGHPPKFVTSPSGRTSRYTDRRTLEIFTMVYRGRINSSIVERLQARNVNAIGLSGADGRLLEGRRKSTIRSVEGGKTLLLRDDHTGTVDSVNMELLTMLLGAGYVPVVTPPAISEEGVLINVDGDRAAAAIATALHADALALLSNVPGLLRDVDDPTSLITHIDADDPSEAESAAQGRMRAKIDGAVRAVQGGVRQVAIATANQHQPLRAALAGAGTLVHRRTTAVKEESSA